MITEKHFVVFYSPGSFYSETSEKPIASWNTKTAVKMAVAIEERHGAKPYAFQFETRKVSDPIPDGDGGTLEVEPKLMKNSGNHFITGHLETLDDVEARNLPKEAILCSNMRGNDMFIICVNTNSFKSTMPFGPEDVIVDLQGEIIERGDNPAYVKYRKQTKARVKRENKS